MNLNKFDLTQDGHMNYQSLKSRQRKERDSYSHNAGIRIHRALSWLHKAEKCQGDLDSEFIFLWVTFNAAYSDSINDELIFSEKERFRRFIEEICNLDSSRKQIYNLIWAEFASSIRLLLENEYVFQPFWYFQNGTLSEENWKEKFKNAKHAAFAAMSNKDTSTVLAIIFSRLYTLRNQILHGGATWNSTLNRSQVRDSTNFLRKLVPIIIEIMMSYSHRFSGPLSYPIIE